MLSPQSLLKGLVSRLLPQGAIDGPEIERFLRASRYGELSMLSMVRKAHLLADEGTYLTVNNGQTGIIEGVKTAFTAANPTLIIANTDNPANPLAKSVYLDYIDLAVSTGGTTATAVTAKWWAAYLDSGNRYSSGGTNLTSLVTSPNGNVVPVALAQIYFGALTATTPTNYVRAIHGQRLARMPVNATTQPDAVGDRLRIEFGGVEPEVPVALGTTGALQANVMQTVQKALPVIIAPGQTFLFYTWIAATSYSTGTTWLPEIGFWLR